MRFGVLYRLRRSDVCFASDVWLRLVMFFAAGEKLMKKSASADFFHFIIFRYWHRAPQTFLRAAVYPPQPPPARGRGDNREILLFSFLNFIIQELRRARRPNQHKINLRIKSLCRNFTTSRRGRHACVARQSRDSTILQCLIKCRKYNGIFLI